MTLTARSSRREVWASDLHRSEHPARTGYEQVYPEVRAKMFDDLGKRRLTKLGW